MIKNTFEAIKEVDAPIKYNYRATSVDVTSPKAQKLYKKILSMKSVTKKAKAERLKLIKSFNNLFGVVVALDHNIVPTVGLTLLAKALSGNISAVSELEINYGAIGNGTGTPTLGSTGLTSEQFRKTDSSLTFNAGKTYVTMFYTAGDFTTTGGIGNIKEHGLFIDGATGAGTGDVWSVILLNAPTGIAKTSLQTLTIDYEVEFTNA